MDSWVGWLTMKCFLLLTVVYFLRCEGAVVITRAPNNERPIIGILAQEQSYYLQGKFPKENYTSYIAASYVKDVEAAGARVVPIMIGKDRNYYRDLLLKINGVLMPGGATYFNQSNGYADAGQLIYEIAKEFNEGGDYFPVFGTCLGFELMIVVASGRRDPKSPENRVSCYSFENLPLNFTPDFRRSKMYKDIPEHIAKLLANYRLTVNAHQFCILDENLRSHNLTSDWKVTAHSNDANGVQFIASIEHNRYPFYGVQFHPEKSSFEWKPTKGYPHSKAAIKANRYFMDFFIEECRKNFHSFTNVAEENKYLIYNYDPVFTGILGSAYHQCYLFEPRGSVHAATTADAGEYGMLHDVWQI